MLYFRKYAFAGCVFLALVLAPGACEKIPFSDTPVKPSQTTGPDEALWTQTFPPIKSNGSTLHFAHYGLEQGLSQSSVEAMLQDNFGFLWIGTQDGLNRYDGYSFKVFRPDPNDPNALSDGYISSIVQGNDNVIWVGTHAGLDRYDQLTGKFSYFLHDDNNPNSLTSDVVQALYQDPNGTVWVGTAQGLDEFNPVNREIQAYCATQQSISEMAISPPLTYFFRIAAESCG